MGADHVKQRWLIIEPSVSGHHAPYLEKIVEGAVEQGLEVVVGSSSDEPSAALCDSLRAKHGRERVSILLEPLPADCRLFGSPGADMRRELGYRRFFRRLYDRAAAKPPVDRVFLPYLDYCANAIGLLGSPFGPAPLDGICMRPTFHFEQMGVVAPRRPLDVLKRVAFDRLLANPSVGRLFTIDETLYKYYQGRKRSDSAKLVFLADPAEFVGNCSREAARGKLGIPSNAKVILLYGSLEPRKGVQSLLDRLQHPDTDPNTHLLIVGKQTPEVSAMFAQPELRRYYEQGRIHEVNRYVSPEEEQVAFAAADAAWLKYEGFYQMSGVLVKAVKAGLELELPDVGLLGWYGDGLRDKKVTFRENSWACAKRKIFDF